MRFEIVKCHGSGNDFPLIDARDIALDGRQWAIVARALADRRGPVGGDGLLLLTARGWHNRRERLFDGDVQPGRIGSGGLPQRPAVRGAAGVRTPGDRSRRAWAEGIGRRGRARGDVAPGVYGVRETAGPASLDTSGVARRAGRVRAWWTRRCRGWRARGTSPRSRCPTRIWSRSSTRIDEAELVAIGRTVRGRAGLAAATAPTCRSSRCAANRCAVRADVRARRGADRQLRQRDGGVELRRVPDRAARVRARAHGVQPRRPGEERRAGGCDGDADRERDLGMGGVGHGRPGDRCRWRAGR